VLRRLVESQVLRLIFQFNVISDLGLLKIFECSLMMKRSLVSEHRSIGICGQF
jgi:hypothetical protein